MVLILRAYCASNSNPFSNINIPINSTVSTKQTETQINQYSCNSTGSIETEPKHDSNSIGFIINHTLDIFKTRFPPFLISYPSSGSTFTRLLLEYTTLFWTGSVYSSALKFINFNGEPYYDDRIIVIKLHPLHFHSSVDNIINMNFENTNRNWRKSPNFQIFNHIKQSLSNVNEEISAIFLLRDLFDSCWSNFQFTVAWQGGYDNEVRNKYKNVSDVVGRHLSSFIMSTDSFNNQLSGSWKRSVMRCATDWLQTFEWIHKFKKANKSILIVEFEKLLHPEFNKQEMSKMLHFIFNDNYLDKNENIMLNRMENMLMNISNIKRVEWVHRVKHRTNRIDKQFAYSILSDETICNMLKLAENQSIMKNISSPRVVNCR